MYATDEMVRVLDGINEVVDRIKKAEKLVDEIEKDQEKKDSVFGELKPAILELCSLQAQIREISNEFEKTTSAEKILEKIENGCTPPNATLFYFFERHPYLKIRLAVIERMIFNCEDACDWAERTIKWLQNDSDGEVIRKLFEKYAGSHIRWKERLQARALEFAISALNEPRIAGIKDELVFKIVNSALKKHRDYWWEVPSMREAVKKMLHPLIGYNSEYSESTWLWTQQAIERILELEDITYIEDIKKIQNGFLKELSYPGNKFGLFAREQHMAFLESAIKQLEEVKKTQWPSIDGFVKSLKFCGIDGEIFSLHPLADKKSNWGNITAMTGKELTIVLEFSYWKNGSPGSGYSQLEGNKIILSQLTFGGRARGFKGMVAKPLFPEENLKPCSWPLNSVFQQQDSSGEKNLCRGQGHREKISFRAGLVVTPTLGHNRLEVHVNLDNESVFHGMIYIIGEDENPESEKQL